MNRPTTFDSFLSTMFDEIYPEDRRFSVIEDDHKLHIKAVVPGFTEKELDIKTKNNRITISGKKETGDKLFSVSESFSKSWYLPAEYSTEDIKAEYKSGVLVVSLTKKKNAIEAKTIPILTA